MSESSIEQIVQDIDLEQALKYLSRCSIWLWKEKPTDLNVRYTELVRGLYRCSEPISQPVLAYIASEVVEHANGTQPFSVETMNNIVQYINRMDVPFEETFETKDQTYYGISILLATGFPQVATGFTDFARLINRFGRYQIIFNDLALQQGTGSMPRFVQQFSSISGVSLSEFLILGKVTFALATMGNGEVNVSNINQGIQLDDITITESSISNFLEFIATSPTMFSVDEIGRKRRQLTLNNPLLRHPIIKTGEHYIAPVPPLLIYRTSEGIYEDFRDNLSTPDRNKFSTDFGNLFEKYVLHLVERTSASWNVWKEQEYKGPRGSNIKSCDIIIQDGQDLILIDCKTSYFRHDVKSKMDRSRYEGDLEKAVNGIETIVRTAKHLRNGTLILNGLNIELIENWAGYVVTFNEFGLYPRMVEVKISDGSQGGYVNLSLIRDQFKKLIEAGITKSQYVTSQDLQQFPEQNLQVLSIDDFEVFLANFVDTDLKLQILATPSDANSSLRNLTHPLLEQKYDEIFGQFRQDEPE